jgi:mRNA interferase RelE/StbE
MNYSIYWSKQSEKFLEKLPKDISYRIVHKVDSIKEFPFHHLEHYEGADFYKLRVGDYRLLIDVDLANKTLHVRVVGHRKNIYKD